MSLGSNPVSTISIDFVRAQGIASTGRISFEPPRQPLTEMMLSSRAVDVFLEEGVGEIELARLPSGTYQVTERIDNKPPYVWSFALPLSASSAYLYEDIVPVTPVPSVYTTVKTVNNVQPDPVTGNVTIATGGGGDGPTVESVDGRSGVVDLSDRYPLISNVNAALGGKAATVHTHNAGQITDFASAADARVSAGIAAWIGAAPVALDTLLELATALNNDPNFAATMTTALGGKANAASVTALAGRVADLEEIPAVSPHRIVRVRDVSQAPGYAIPESGTVWVLLEGGPEYSIPAAEGDDLEISYNLLVQSPSNWSMDLVVVTGPTPTRGRYLASGSVTPAFSGNPADYPQGAAFQGRTGVMGITVQPSDIDNGLVRLRWAINSSNSGLMYASSNYPLILSMRNSGPSAV